MTRQEYKFKMLETIATFHTLGGTVIIGFLTNLFSQKITTASLSGPKVQIHPLLAMWFTVGLIGFLATYWRIYLAFRENNEDNKSATAFWWSVVTFSILISSLIINVFI